MVAQIELQDIRKKDKQEKQALVPREPFRIERVEDESNNLDAVLTPLPSIDARLYEGTKKTLAHFSRTQGFEIDTPRTNFLQSIVDGMTGANGITERLFTISGKPVDARVVIMNKGRKDDAFVAPDGTICIAQYLVNNLEKEGVAAVGGVIAHEINHIVKETAVKLLEADESEEFGVGWLHEAVGDNLAPDLLRKVGLNSLGFARAIMVISEKKRGSIHQTGIGRAAQNVGMHMGLDYDTSDLEIVPFPQGLKTDVLPPPTNLEMVSELILAEDAEHIAQILPKLYVSEIDFRFLGSELYQM